MLSIISQFLFQQNEFGQNTNVGPVNFEMGQLGPGPILSGEVSTLPQFSVISGHLFWHHPIIYNRSNPCNFEFSLKAYKASILETSAYISFCIANCLALEWSLTSRLWCSDKGFRPCTHHHHHQQPLNVLCLYRLFPQNTLFLSHQHPPNSFDVLNVHWMGSLPTLRCLVRCRHK